MKLAILLLNIEQATYVICTIAALYSVWVMTFGIAGAIRDHKKGVKMWKINIVLLLKCLVGGILWGWLIYMKNFKG